MNKLRVWHIPQIGAGAPVFHVPVTAPAEAIQIINILADYDQFQYINAIKPDYSNVSGLEYFNDDTQEWEEWYSEYGDDVFEHQEYMSTFK